MAQEFIRWEETYPSLGWAYASSLIGSMAVLADAFARIGDLELFQFSTSEGFSTSAGTMTPDGGPKNLLAVMTHHAKYVDKSIARYGTDQASRNGNPAYVIGPVNVLNGEAWVNENFWMQANLYYRDPYLQSIYLRTAPNSHPYPANPSTGGWFGWTGCCGIYPGVPFMFGQMQGKVWPYPKTTTDDTDHIGSVSRTWVWRSFLRGHNPILMDWMHKPSPWYRPASQEATHKVMGQTQKMANRVNLAQMIPRGDLASTGYCLAYPGTEYLVYWPKSGEASSIELKPGTYRCEWFNPAKGESGETGSVKASGGAQQFKAQFESDAVLWLERTSTLD